MSEFIKPRFKQVAVFEALLKKADVEKYAQENNVSIDEAIGILGRQYVSKYSNYCAVWDKDHSTPIQIIKPKTPLQKLQDDGHSIGNCPYCSAYTVDGWCDNCGSDF